MALKYRISVVVSVMSLKLGVSVGLVVVVGLVPAVVLALGFWYGYVVMLKPQVVFMVDPVLSARVCLAGYVAIVPVVLFMMGLLR